jgi:flagellar M-ring protein FliF
VVNHRGGTDPKGKPTSTPLSDKELEQLTALVQQGIGFNAERGDVVKVVNAPFRTEVPPPVDELPLWQQPWLLDLLKTAAAPGALVLVALLIVTMLIRPALTAMLAPPPPPEKGSQLDEVVAEDAPPALPPMQLLPVTKSERVEQARALAKSNPAAVANIVRGWVSGEVT